MWVVAKMLYRPDDHPDYTVEVEEKGYWDKERAEKRAKHVREQDKVWAGTWPVKFWASGLIVQSDNVPPPYQPTALATVGRGQEMIAYADPSRHKLRLRPVPSESEQLLQPAVSSAWSAWREQRANAGDFDAAAPDAPSAQFLRALYQEPALPAPEQLSLPLRGLEAPVH